MEECFSWAREETPCPAGGRFLQHCGGRLVARSTNSWKGMMSEEAQRPWKVLFLQSLGVCMGRCYQVAFVKVKTVGTTGRQKALIRYLIKGAQLWGDCTILTLRRKGDCQ